MALRAWLGGAEFPHEDESVNASLEAIADLLDPAAVAASVAAIAGRLDVSIEGLTAEQRADLATAGFGYAISRWEHREDHIAQIEAVLD